MDSQATSQEAIEALIAEQEQEHDITVNITSQDVLDQLDYRRQPVIYGKWLNSDAQLCRSLTFKTDHDISEEPESSEELCAHCVQAEMERDQAFEELASIRCAYEETLAAKIRAEEELAEWKRAAVSAAPLVDLISRMK